MKKFKVGDIELEVNPKIMEDMRFAVQYAHLTDNKRSEQAHMVDFVGLCDFMFGEENIPLIMDELAKDNDGVCTPETFGAWLGGVLEEISEVKN